MARATCRCGHQLTVPDGSEQRVVCPSCGARVRVRSRPSSAEVPGDGYFRFSCPCGRRLKVPADAPPSHGKCPDCGRIVPVPAAGAGPGSRTDELQADEARALDAWAARHREAGSRVPENIPPGPDVPAAATPAAAGPAGDRIEAGLRLCPNCRRPVHLGSEVCRHCGAAVPKG